MAVYMAAILSGDSCLRRAGDLLLCCIGISSRIFTLVFYFVAFLILRVFDLRTAFLGRIVSCFHGFIAMGVFGR